MLTKLTKKIFCEPCRPRWPCKPCFMKFNVITIFPKIISDYCDETILNRAQKQGIIKINPINLRDFTTDNHKTVDDTPYGGGPGMILKVEPIYKCLENLKLVKNGKKSKIKNLKSKIVILDPAGKKFDQKMARRFAKLENLVLICGRYEGFDERVYKFADEKISVGDYVLAGGELPAMIIIEAVARLLPGVVGNPDSLNEETFGQRLADKDFVEYAQYTKPAEFNGLKVPEVLLSGDHKKIEEWRKKLSTT